MEKTIALFFFVIFNLVMLSPYYLAFGTGYSMQPLLTNNGLLVLKKAQLHDGDIVGYYSLNYGEKIIHRINAHVDLGTQGVWYWICGDNEQGRLCEWIEQSQIHGKLDAYLTIPIQVIR